MVPGPQTAACLTAQGVVAVKAKAAVRAALALGEATAGITPEQQAKIDAQVKVVTDLRAKLDTALVALDKSPSVANATAAQKIGADLTAAYGALVALPGVANLGAAKDEAAKAQTALSVALAAQMKACSTDGPPRPTATPSPTTSPTPSPTASPAPSSPAPAPNPSPSAPLYADCAAVVAAGAAPLAAGAPGYRAELDSDSDGVACEVTETGSTPVVTIAPSGGVETGAGPA